MIANTSLWHHIVHASPVVQSVMMLLFFASLISWTLIVQRNLFFKKIKKTIKVFEDQFWSGTHLDTLYDELKESEEGEKNVRGLVPIFLSGFKTFMHFSQRGESQADVKLMMGSVARAMRIAKAREVEQLDQHLSFMATVGSTSPYVGLLGTVWGIMTAFQALGGIQQQVTIAMVAPGIAEALVATAMGLFAAIPAVVAYNQYSHQADQLTGVYDTFQEEFLGILERKLLG